MIIYFCQDSGVSERLGSDDSAWLSENFEQDLEVCRQASSEEVSRLWMAGWKNFDGQTLDLADGKYIATVGQKSYRGSSKRFTPYLILDKV